ncbi:hypothetical protein ABGB16_20855 [Micromonospora sp. B11E3]|uniref:hypothetical protein n=1 Tax=Micromonospora sp. B11E3 TaxID=3153562 RepID=UPI00325C9914
MPLVADVTAWLPGVYGAQGCLARGCCGKGVVDGLLAAAGAVDADDNRAGAIGGAFDDEDGAGGMGGGLDCDGPDEQASEAAEAAVADDDHGGGAGLGGEHLSGSAGNDGAGDVDARLCCRRGVSGLVGDVLGLVA